MDGDGPFYVVQGRGMWHQIEAAKVFKSREEAESDPAVKKALQRGFWITPTAVPEHYRR